MKEIIVKNDRKIASIMCPRCKRSIIVLNDSGGVYTCPSCRRTVFFNGKRKVKSSKKKDAKN